MGVAESAVAAAFQACVYAKGVYALRQTGNLGWVFSNAVHRAAANIALPEDVGAYMVYLLEMKHAA